jgi:hyperosmotically inducible periplasmic protein
VPTAGLSQTPATATASTEDDRIVDQVRLRLAGDADVKGGNLEVTSKDGAVVIKGRVETEKGRSKASKLAKKVKGVKSVDNQLSVGPPL